MPPDLRFQERVKIGVRKALRRYDVDLIRHPYTNRLAAALRSLEIETVVDVGANIGQYASALRSAGYPGRIVSCEPLSDAFAHLQRRAARDSRWDTVRTAVGAEPAELDIHVSANSYSSSLRPMTDAHLHAAPDSRVIRTERVEVTTVTRLVGELGIRVPSTLLKVDTQGHEKDVLDGAGALLGDFAAVQLEMSFVPLYEGQELFGPLERRMADAGFEVYGLEPGIAEPSTGRLLQCDALFVNAARLGPAHGAPIGEASGTSRA